MATYTVSFAKEADDWIHVRLTSPWRPVTCDVIMNTN